MNAGESGQVGTKLEPNARTDERPRAQRLVPADPPLRRVTYIDIQAYVRRHHGFTPRTGWIAHVKELNGLSLRPTHNRGANARVVRCPPERQPAIAEALRHFGLL